jgi:hypothetical protein
MMITNKLPKAENETHTNPINLLPLKKSLPLGVAEDLEGMLVGDFDANILLVKALSLAIDLPSLISLIDCKIGSQCALALLTLAMRLTLSLDSLNVCLALSLAIDLAQQFIDLGKVVVEGGVLGTQGSRTGDSVGVGEARYWSAETKRIALLCLVGGRKTWGENKGNCWYSSGYKRDRWQD